MEEQDNKVKEDKTPDATELGKSEKEFEGRMMRDMDRADNHHIDGVPFEPIERDPDDPTKGGQPQVSMKSLLNFRDFKGRTPLHIATISRNQAACETLLYLGANPLIEDGAGYRPIDYVDP